MLHYPWHATSKSTWPGLTEQLVQRFLDKQEATIMGHMHARKSGVQSTKPKIVKLPTGTDKRDKEEDGQLEQQEPPRPSVLNDWNEYVGAHVVDFTALKGYSNGPMWKISNNIQLRNEIHLCLIRL